MYLKPPNFSFILILALSVYGCVFYCITVVLSMNIFLLFPRYFYFSTILYPLNFSTFICVGNLFLLFLKNSLADYKVACYNSVSTSKK